MDRWIAILSIDGGGVRGIIPAMILDYVEKTAGLPVYRLFDLVAGTSTGGVIAVTLTKATALGQNEYTAADLVHLFESACPLIFRREETASVPVAGETFDERSTSGAMQLVLDTYAGSARLKDALTNVLVTSYDVQGRRPVLFRSWAAKKVQEEDFLIRDVARATSAVPTVFEPHRIGDRPNEPYYLLIDGGVVAGNPTLCAVLEARRLYPAAPHLVVSIGTGQATRGYSYDETMRCDEAGWAQRLMDIVGDSSGQTVDEQVATLLEGRQQAGTCAYYRLQPRLGPSIGGAHDASPENLGALRAVASSFVRNYESVLQEVSDRLRRNRDS
jgi:patatin-like phospholipase/acyl hydrolase